VILLRRRDQSVEATLGRQTRSGASDPRLGAQIDVWAKEVKSQELIDNRFLEEMDRSGFFDQLWAKR